MNGGGGRERWLFVSPAWPRPGGTGLAMRAWAVAQALGRSRDVTVLVPQDDGLPRPTVLPEGCTAWEPGQPRRWRKRLQAAIKYQAPGVYPSLFREPADWAGGAPDSAAKPFDGVHIFRLAMAPYAEPYLGRVPCQLDLDEDEARTREGIAALLRARGRTGEARMLAWEARFYRRAASVWLPRFTRLFVSSGREADLVRNRFPAARVEVIPNTVSLPPAAACVPAPDASAGRPFTFLFVGNLNYFPNQDAVRYFGEDVLPFLRERARQPFAVRIVGAGGSGLRTPDFPGWHRVGYADDLAAEYARAHAVIVPIRVGGGTRIKILEAFAWKRPVVATGAGAEGIDALHERHLLLADSKQEFASACVRLMEQPQLARLLSANARELAETHYDCASLAALF